MRKFLAVKLGIFLCSITRIEEIFVTLQVGSRPTIQEMTTFYKNILQLVLSPSSGWEDVAATKSKPQQLAQQCMYPLMGLAALAVFLQLIYEPEVAFTIVLVRAVALFVSYFVTYFFACACVKQYIGRYVEDDVDDERCHTMIIYALSLLALASIVCSLLPLSVGLPYLMPMAVALVLWKACTYLHVSKEHELRFVVLVLVAIVLPPTLIQTMFDYMLAN